MLRSQRKVGVVASLSFQHGIPTALGATVGGACFSLNFS